jgi:hypothetical protein
MVIFGTIVVGLQYPLLADIHGVGWMLLALVAISSIGETFYWTCYHAYFASLGDAEHRGHQVSAREAIAAVIGIAGPLIGGWTLTAFGPRVAFGAMAAVQILSALPLFGTPDVAIPQEAHGTFRAAIPGVLVFVADGWISSGNSFVWQIALFLALGESFSAFGGAMALAAVAGAMGGLALGRYIDRGKGSHAVFVTLMIFSATILQRSFSTGNAGLAVAANACGALAVCLYIPTTMTAIYNQAKHSPCALRFHMATEAGWDLGATTGCLSAAALSALGAPLSSAILLSLLGIAPLFILLRRHYNETLLTPLPD